MFPSACSGVAINDDGSNTRQKCDVDIHDGLDDSAFRLRLHLGPGHLLSLHSSSAQPCSGPYFAGIRGEHDRVQRIRVQPGSTAPQQSMPALMNIFEQSSFFRHIRQTKRAIPELGVNLSELVARNGCMLSTDPGSSAHKPAES